MKLKPLNWGIRDWQIEMALIDPPLWRAIRFYPDGKDQHSQWYRTKQSAQNYIDAMSESKSGISGQ